jgi:hypothetical protein
MKMKTNYSTGDTQVLTLYVTSLNTSDTISDYLLPEVIYWTKKSVDHPKLPSFKT